MANRHFSDEDLRELLEYIASNPAIPFPTLTTKEREDLVRDVLDQYDEMYKNEFEPKKPDAELVIKAMVDSLRKTPLNGLSIPDVTLFIRDNKQPR
jgi:antitoxin component of RelBE/YafQ-DinJ toxin-antitoxin module